MWNRLRIINEFGFFKGTFEMSENGRKKLNEKTNKIILFFVWLKRK